MNAKTEMFRFLLTTSLLWPFWACPVMKVSLLVIISDALRILYMRITGCFRLLLAFVVGILFYDVGFGLFYAVCCLIIKIDVKLIRWDVFSLKIILYCNLIGK